MKYKISMAVVATVFALAIAPAAWTTPIINESARLVASDRESGEGDEITSDRFGNSVSLSADASTAEVGTIFDDKEINAGAAYIYTLAADSNDAPLANAGLEQSVYVNDTVTLDGSRSYDPDGDLLNYSWIFTSMPEGSMAILFDPDAVNPTFTVDMFGTYEVSLTVNDGTVYSTPLSVTITTLDSAPVADAGPYGYVYLNDLVLLDGSSSSDVQGDMLTYSWSFATKPVGSNTTISYETDVFASFVVDIPGDYVVQLIVNDGTVYSSPDTTTISTLNSRPVADSGGDQAVYLSNTVTLDGSNSWDPDGDPLSFSWAFTSIPADSNVVQSGTNTDTFSFTVDVAGAYVVSLIVDDGTADSNHDMVSISTINVPPVADAGNNQSVVAAVDGR